MPIIYLFLGETNHVKLIRPRPICSVVSCDVEGISLDGFEKIDDGIYGQPYEFAHVSPSLIGDYLFCPRFLWLQARLKMKMTTERGAIASVRGKVLHDRYERYLQQYENVITEYRIEVGDIVAVADAVYKLDSVYVIELKSSAVPREAHRLQAQAYMELLKAKHGYLVYRDRVEHIERDKKVLDILDNIRKVLSSETPPPPGRNCATCPFAKVCKDALRRA